MKYLIKVVNKPFYFAGIDVSGNIKLSVLNKKNLAVYPVKDTAEIRKSKLESTFNYKLEVVEVEDELVTNKTR